MKTVKEWHTYLLRALCEHPLSMRESIGSFLSIEEVSQLLQRNKPWPKNALQRLPAILKKKVTTHDELQIFSECLTIIFEREQNIQLNLIPPKKIGIMPAMPAAITHKHCNPVMIDTLIKGLYQENDIIIDDADTFNNKIAWGKLLLLIAFESNLTTCNELDELLTISTDTWRCYSSSNDITIFLPRNHRRVWLQPCSALLYSALTRIELRPIYHAKALIQCYLNHKVGAITFEGPAKIIRDIGLYHQPLGLSSFWAEEQSLPEHAIERLFGGKIVAPAIKREHIVHDVVLSIPITMSSHYNDEKQKRKIQSVFRNFVAMDEKEKRKGHLFQQAEQQLTHCLHEDISEGLFLAIYWIREIFTKGTPWKGELTISTIQAYFSTIMSFIKNGYQQQPLQNLSSKILTEQCQQGLNSIDNSTQQFTILRFLKFINQSPALEEIQIDEFLVMNNSCVVRSNYLSPHEFEVICNHYLQDKGDYESKIVFFMRCCYYLGLREDEAIHLKFTDINFNTKLVAVTPDKRRKSAAAIRDIPFCILPTAFIQELTQIVNQQKTLENAEYLFSDWDYASLEKQFITHLRRYTKDTTWVTHLLRHCFANNLLLQLMLSTKLLPAIPDILACEIFSHPHQLSIQKTFMTWGSTLSPTFPILDWIAQIVGHASAVTTSTIYLHLLDWSIAKKFVTPYPISKLQLQNWLGNKSTHVFEIQKKIGSNVDDRALLLLEKEPAMALIVKKVFSQGIRVQTPYKTKIQYKSKSVCFSRLFENLSRLKKGGNDDLFDPDFIQFIRGNPEVPDIPVLSKKELPAWIRLCQHFDKTLDNKIQSKSVALLFLKEKLLSEDQQINNIKELKKYLFAIDLFGVEGFTIQINVASKIPANWETEIKKVGFNLFHQTSKQKMPSARIKPRQLHWVLWQHIHLVIELVEYYQLYLKRSKLRE